MKLGLAFICGTETDQIKEMLDSVACVKFDSISAVMTRPSPDTYKILQEYGCKINSVIENWNDDYSNWNFAEARELSYRDCHTDWIIYLDSDDVLENAGKLREVVEEFKDYDAISLAYDYEPNNVYFKERVVKKGKYKWFGYVHEYLDPLGDVRWHASGKVVVKHRMIGNDRHQRNLAIVEREYGVKKTERNIFYAGKDNMCLGKLDKAKKYFEEFIAMSFNGSQKHNAYMSLVNIALMQGDDRNLTDLCQKAAELEPNLAEPYYKLAIANFRKGYYGECLRLLGDGFRKIQEPPYGTPYNKLDFTVNPSQLFSNALKKIGGRMTDLEKAKIGFSDASVELELAQSKYSKAKQTLVQELNKAKAGAEER